MTKEFRDFESAREFVRSLNLKGHKEWQEYCKSGNKPDDIPAGPNVTYTNEFKGYGNWLGDKKLFNGLKIFRPFKEAREFARSLGLKSGKEWQEYCKSGNKPDDITSNPNLIYKNQGWKSRGDWLGTGTVSNLNRQFRPFKEAREFARKLKLKNRPKWNEYCKSGNKPNDIPVTPNNAYKKEWDGWFDFLHAVSNLNRQFRPFKEAREFVRSLGLKSTHEWYAYCSSGNKPDDITSNPNKVYKKDWKGIDDFLNVAPISSFDKQFRPFKEAREFARSLGLKGIKEWQEYSKSGDRPDDIPSAPNQIYKNEGYVNSRDWLGAGIISSKDRSFSPFKEAKEFVKTLNLKGDKEWREYCKSGNKPDDVPIAPWLTYAEEWIGLGDWLGTGNISTNDKLFRPFKEAREFVRALNLKSQKEWQEYCKSGNKPEDIPSNPGYTYKLKVKRKFSDAT